MKRVSLVILASVLCACAATRVPVSDKTVVKAKAEILNASTLNELAFTLIGSEPTTAPQPFYRNEVELRYKTTSAGPQEKYLPDLYKKPILVDNLGLDRSKDPDGTWKTFLPDKFKKAMDMSAEQKRSYCYVITELKLVRRPSREIYIPPGMIVLVSPSTSDRWQGLFWVPAHSTPVIEGGAWSPSGVGLTIGPTSIRFRDYVTTKFPIYSIVVAEPGKGRKVVPLESPMMDTGVMEISGTLKDDTFRLLFSVPKDATQHSLQLRLLDALIADVPSPGCR